MSSSTAPVPIAAVPSAAAPAQPPRPRHRWLRVVLWLTVFGSGFVAGTGMTLIGVRKGMLDAIHHPETMPKKAAQRLRRPLQLSEDQVQRIEQIIRDRQQSLQQIRIRVQPEVEAELDVINREISQVLDDKQRAKWNQIFHQLRKTWLPQLPPPGSSAPPAGQPPDSATPASSP